METQELDFDITKYHKCISDLYWHGCYEGDGYFKQYFEPSTYAHPAKISPLLADRIFKHLEKLELLKEGMTVLDFMAGSGRIPLMASLRGYKGLGVELEPHFVKMCNDNKKFAENKIGRKLDMEIIKGDSRQLSKLLNKSDVAILSPPYGLGEGIGHSGQSTQVVKDLNLQTRYGSSEGNIGNLPYKQMVGVVSPPYQDSISSEKDGINWSKGKFQPERDRSSESSFKHNYSQNPENIGNLKDSGSIVGITSPPYEQLVNRDRKNETNAVNKPDFIRGGRSQYETYGENQENIGNLKDTSFVGITSPPYEKSEVFQDKSFIEKINLKSPKRISNLNSANGVYAESQDNLGNQQGQNYLSAMLQVYKEASKVCSVICTVTKNPTRNGKLRRLDIDTVILLEKSGYQIVDYHRAVLFKTYEQSTLTGGTKKEHKGRLSFFKRLSLNKGNQAAMFEDIIIAVKNG